MSVNLARGENVSLTKEDPGLVRLMVGLGWRIHQQGGDNFDLDPSVFLLNADRKVASDQDFVFYNNPVSPCGSITHHGDSKEGQAGEGDAEQILIDLSRIPPEVEHIVFCVSIYQADIRLQDFGMVEGAYLRLINEVSGAEIAHFNLSEKGADETAMVLGELYRFASEWRFRAIGHGVLGGLAAVATGYGVNIES